MTGPEPTAGQPASPLAPPGIDTTVAHPARMLNYVLGGTANFPVDREAAERRLEVLPGWRTSAQQNRQFHGRAIRLAVLHFIPDAADPVGIVRTLLAALPAGSYLIASHPTQDFNPVRSEQAAQVGTAAGVPVWLRTHIEFTAFFAGLDLLDPGVVLVSDWRPEPGQPRPDPHLVTCYGAVAGTPG